MEFSGKLYLMHLLLNCTFMVAMLVCCAQFAREKNWLTALLQQTFCSFKGMYIFFHFYQLLKFIFFCLSVKIKYFLFFSWFETFIRPFLSFVPLLQEKKPLCLEKKNTIAKPWSFNKKLSW